MDSKHSHTETHSHGSETTSHTWSHNHPHGTEPHGHDLDGPLDPRELITEIEEQPRKMNSSDPFLELWHGKED